MTKKTTYKSKSPIWVDPKLDHSYYLKFAVKPNARKTQILEDYEDLRLYIPEPPEKGKANKAIIKFLSKRLKIPASLITLVQGHTSTTKIFHITLENTDVAKIYEKLVNYPE